jgi:hypothetical protein
MILSKKIYLLAAIICSCLFMSADILSSSVAPEGYTGAEGGPTCKTCHSGNPTNSPGGAVVINNLPSTYSPGATYNFSVTINHSASDRKRWGFAMKAIAGGNNAGTFTETNPNAFVNTAAGELGHNPAASTPPSSSYTYNNLSWTAPANPSSAEQNITFYIASNAAGGDDFVYTATKTMTLSTSSVVNNNLILDQLNVSTAGKNIHVSFQNKKATTLKAAILNYNGQKLIEKTMQKFSAGTNSFTVDGTRLTAGTYIVRLQNEKEYVSKKIKID